MLNSKKLKLNKQLFKHIFFIILFVFCSIHFIVRAKDYNDVKQQSYNIVNGIPTIIDGDSIRVNGLELRLFGMDAPELFQLCGDKNKYYCGKKAKEHLINLIGNKAISCKYRKFDKYHRALALCFLGNNLLNKTMVANGWAVSYYSFKKEEAKARKAKLGIWQSPFEKPQKWRKKHHHAKRPLANPQIAN